MLTRSTFSTRWFAVALAAASVSACGGANDNLDAYINEVKARPGGRIEILTSVEPGDRISPQCLMRRVRDKLIGNRSADFIRANGHNCRSNRPDT